jgi:predicted amidohydrolase YtcJ
LRGGKDIGARERLTLIGALKAMTLWRDDEIFEQTTRASIEAGKLAKLVIVSANPLRLDQAMINQIEVL